MFYLLCISIYVYIYVYIDIYIKNWKVELLSKSKKLSLWFYSFRCSSMCLLIDFYIYMFLSFCLFYTSIDSYDHSCRYVCIYILTLFKMYLLRFLHLTSLYFYITIFLIISLNPWIKKTMYYIFIFWYFQIFVYVLYILRYWSIKQNFHWNEPSRPKGSWATMFAMLHFEHFFGAERARTKHYGPRPLWSWRPFSKD